MTGSTSSSATNGDIRPRSRRPRPGTRPSTRDVAVGQVDDPHHAEHQRQPAREQRVQPAEEDALDDRVDPGHRRRPPGRGVPPQAEVGLGDLLTGDVRGGGREHDPALEHADARAPATDSARPRSCSTSTTRGAVGDQRPQRRVDPLDGDRAPARARPRRAAAAAGWSSAPGRSRWPAARRRTASRPAWPQRSRASGTPRAPCRGSTARAGPGRPATSRFSSTVSSGNSRRPSGTSAIPRATPLVGAARAVTSLAVEDDARPAAAGCAPAMVRSSVVLPAPFAPTRASTSPSLHRQRHLPYRLQQAVPGDEAARPRSRRHATAFPR